MLVYYAFSGLWALCRAFPLLPYLVPLPLLLLAVPGRGTKVLALLYAAALACCAVEEPLLGLIRCLGSHFWGTLGNPPGSQPSSSSLPFPPGPGAAALGSLECPRGAGTGLVLLLGTGTVLAAVGLWFRVKRRFRSIAQRAAPEAGEAGGTLATPAPATPAPGTGTAAPPTSKSSTLATDTVVPANPATDTAVTPTPATSTPMRSTAATPVRATHPTVTPTLARDMAVTLSPATDTSVTPTLTTDTMVTPMPTTGTSVTPTCETPAPAAGSMVTPTPVTDTTATPIPAMDTAVTATPITPTSGRDTAATPAPVTPALGTDTTAELGNCCEPVSVVPARKKKWTRKSAYSGRDGEAAPTPDTATTPTLVIPTSGTATTATPVPETPTLGPDTTATPIPGTDTPATPTPETPTPGTDTAATPAPVTPALGTDTAATPTLVTPTSGIDTAATPAPVTPTLETDTAATPTLVTPTSGIDTAATPALVTPALGTDTAATPAPVTPTLETDTAATPTLVTPTSGIDTTATPALVTPALGTDTAATPAPVTPTLETDTAATPAPVTPALGTDTAAELGNCCEPVSVVPARKKKRTRKSAYSGRDGEAAPEEEGALAKNSDIDVVMSKGAPACSLWRGLAAGTQARFPVREEAMCRPAKWTTMAGGIQYLRELAMREQLYHSPNNAQLPYDLDEVRCSRVMWQEVVRSAPPPYTSTLAMLDLGGDGDKAPTVGEVITWLRQHEQSPSSPLRMCAPAVEELPDVPELRRALMATAAGWYATIHISEACLSIPIAPECQAQFAFTWRGVQYTWSRLPPGWKHTPVICHRVIRDLLEKSRAPEHLQYVDDIITWGDADTEVFEKGRKIIKILVEAGFTVMRSDVKGPAREVTFLGMKFQGGRRRIPVDVVNEIMAASPPTSEEEVEAFLELVGSWQTHIPNYSQITAPLCQKKSSFSWGPAQQQAFEQVKQEVTHAVALGPVRAGHDVKNVLYTAAGRNGPTWSLWQKAPRESWGQPLGFWSRGYDGPESRYTPTEKEILAAYEGVRTASKVVGPKAQLLLAPRLPVLDWVLQGKVPSTHRATNATWGTWAAAITRRAQAGSTGQPGILEEIMDWPEDDNVGVSPEDEVMCAAAAAPRNEPSGNESYGWWDLQPLEHTFSRSRLVSQH